MSSPAPAARAAGPNAANTPAPIIEPSPITTASTVPSRRDSSGIPEPFYQCVKIRLFSNSAPPTLTASHSRPERGGNSAGRGGQPDGEHIGGQARRPRGVGGG